MAKAKRLLEAARRVAYFENSPESIRALREAVAEMDEAYRDRGESEDEEDGDEGGG